MQKVQRLCVGFLCCLLFQLPLWCEEWNLEDPQEQWFSDLASDNYADDSGLLARIWLEQAWEIVKEDNISNDEWKQAFRALNVSREFKKKDVDGLLVQARLLLHLETIMEELPRESVSSLMSEKSSAVRVAFDLVTLSLEDHSRVPFIYKARLWSALAIRLKEYRLIVKVFEEWPEGDKQDSVLLYAAALASVYLGMSEKASHLANRGVVLSDKKDLVVLGKQFDLQPEAAFWALAVVSGDKNSIIQLNSAIHRWKEDIEKALEPWLLSRRIVAGNFRESFFIRGKQIFIDYSFFQSFSNKFMLLAELLSGFGQLDSLQDLSFEYYTDAAFLKQLRDLGLLEGKQIFKEFPALEDAVIVSDGNYDGYVEKEISIAKGQIVYISLDEDQNGIKEMVFYNSRTEAGHMQNRVSIDGGNLDIIFEDYPLIKSMLFHDEPAGEIEVVLRPGVMRWQPVDLSDILAPFRPFNLDYNEVFQSALTFKITSQNDTVIDELLIFIDQGMPIRSTQRTFAVGKPDENLNMRELIYKQGIPIAGRQSFQTKVDNGAPLWQLYEHYEDGDFVGLAWHPDMKGEPAYLRDWALGRYLDTRIWDLDMDGWIDIKNIILDMNIDTSGYVLPQEAVASDFIPWISSGWSPWK